MFLKENKKIQMYKVMPWLLQVDIYFIIDSLSTGHL